MSQDSVDLAPGAVLHIRGYSSRGHAPKNKYLLILGRQSESVALAFIISSQLHYLQSEVYRNEVVRIPDKATHFLSCESLIQCFELERLSVDLLCEGWETKRVANVGRLPTRYLHTIKSVVKDSSLLATEDIHQVLEVLGG